RVGFVAGEHSGDQLGAALIAALRERVPGLECFGIAGPKMIAAGCEAWWGAEQLSVMGLAEVLRHLPRLLRLRAAVARRFRAARRALGVEAAAPVVALLPGSRLTEVVRLGAPFAAAAAHIAARRPGFRFIAPMASPAVRELFVKQVAQVPDAPQIRLLDGEAQ